MDEHNKPPSAARLDVINAQRAAAMERSKEVDIDWVLGEIEKLRKSIDELETEILCNIGRLRRAAYHLPTMNADSIVGDEADDDTPPF